MRIGRNTAAGAETLRSSGMVHAIGIVNAELRRWPARRWWIALASATATYVLIAIPTNLINTPFFAREVPPTGWSSP